MNRTITSRGFTCIDFADRDGAPCSLASEDAIWFGSNTSPRMHLTQEQVAVLLPYLHRFVETGDI